MLWAFLHVSKLVWSYLGGSWSDRVPRVRLVIAGWVVYAITYLAFGYANQGWHAWVLMGIYGSFYGLSEPAEKALMKDLAPEGARGAAFGSYNFVVGIASLPAGLLMGWLWWSQGHRAALATGAAIAVTAALLLASWEASRTRDARLRHAAFT